MNEINLIVQSSVFPLHYFYRRHSGEPQLIDISVGTPYETTCIRNHEIEREDKSTLFIFTWQFKTSVEQIDAALQKPTPADDHRYKQTTQIVILEISKKKANNNTNITWQLLPIQLIGQFRQASIAEHAPFKKIHISQHYRIEAYVYTKHQTTNQTRRLTSRTKCWRMCCAKRIARTHSIRRMQSIDTLVREMKQVSMSIFAPKQTKKKRNSNLHCKMALLVHWDKSHSVVKHIDQSTISIASNNKIK